MHKKMIAGIASSDKQFVHLQLNPSFSLVPPFDARAHADFFRLSFRFILLLFFGGSSAFGVSAAIVAGWSWDRLIPCHGDVLETGGKKAWTSTLGELMALAAQPGKK